MTLSEAKRDAFKKCREKSFTVYYVVIRDYEYFVKDWEPYKDEVLICMYANGNLL
jgi:hypothetical protein